MRIDLTKLGTMTQELRKRRFESSDESIGGVSGLEQEYQSRTNDKISGIEASLYMEYAAEIYNSTTGDQYLAEVNRFPDGRGGPFSSRNCFQPFDRARVEIYEKTSGGSCEIIAASSMANPMDQDYKLAFPQYDSNRSDEVFRFEAMYNQVRDTDDLDDLVRSKTDMVDE